MLTASQRATLLDVATRAGQLDVEVQLRASLDAETDLTAEARDELLARAVRKEHVELYVELLAYEQGKRLADGTIQKNRKRVRVRDGAMMGAGRTGKGAPFLRDHDLSALAVGGRVFESKTIKVDDGHYQIRQRVKLTEPTAVERALRGLMGAVSVWLRPTGPIECTACKAEIFTKCWHLPGDMAEVKGEQLEVEWEITDCELAETSEVAVGAVQTAGIETIRAAFAALSIERGQAPQRTKTVMTKMQQLAQKLGLAATATDEEILAAAATHVDAAAADKEELRILQLEAKIEGSTAVDKFIATSLAEGRIKPADEPLWRELFAASPERARANMAKRPAQSAQPAGAPLQSAGKDPTPPPEALAAPAPAADRDAKARTALAATGRDYDRVTKFARQFGAKDPKAAVAKHAAGITEEI